MSLRESSQHAKAHSDSIWSLSWTSSSQLLSSSVDETVKVWRQPAGGDDAKWSLTEPTYVLSANNVFTAKEAHQLQSENALPASAGILSAVGTKDNKTVITSSMDGSIRIYELAEEPKQKNYINVGPLETWNIALHPNEDLLAGGSHKGHINLFSVSKAEKIATLPAPAPSSSSSTSSTSASATSASEKNSWIVSITFSPDGNYLAAGLFDGRVLLHRLQAITTTTPTSESVVIAGHTRAVRGLAFSSDSTTLYSASDDGHVHIHDVRTGQVSTDIHAHASWVLCVAVPNTNAPYLLTGGSEGRIKLWDLRTKEAVSTLEVDQSSIWATAFCPDKPETLAVATENGTIAFVHAPSA